MRKEKIQYDVLNKLLDKYEKSKTFSGTNQVKQNFSIIIPEMFPKYNDDAEYDLFCEINEAVKELEKDNLIFITYKRGNIINMASLNDAKLSECYSYVRREPKKDAHRWLLEIMHQFSGNVVLDRYFETQRKKIGKNQKVEYYDDDKKDFVDLLKLVSALLENENEVFVRDFSMKLFHDSKRIEKLESKAKALLYQYGDFLTKDSVLEECNVLKTPTYVSVKGKGVLLLGKQRIDLSLLAGDIALSTESLKELDKVIVTGTRVITVENLTSFHNYAGEDDFVIYLGGFHNRTKRRFLMMLYKDNPDKEYRHFGDIDAGGFYILEHLIRKTGIPFQSMYMDKDTLIQHMKHTKPLTANDRKRMEGLLGKLEDNKGKIKDNTKEKEDSAEKIEDYREVLRFMLEKGCKLEQEAVKENSNNVEREKIQ